ncbi:MAG: nucleotide-binding protein [Bryobacteraceae bacterium]|nr:nucleotide-binding protein [Bryobacteraceae bacterium]
MRAGITRINRRLDDLELFDPNVISERWAPEVVALQTAIEETLAAVFGPNTVQFNRYASATNLDHGAITMSMGPQNPSRDRADAQRYLTEGKRSAILLLRQAIRGMEEEITHQQDEAAPNQIPIGTTPPTLARKVFIVHGHDEGVREAVARFLTQIEFEPVILHEQANQGRTIIEKVEAHGDVPFAVVILTPDDEGRAQDGDLRPRARQNVLLELGFFLGRLGRRNVCALKRGELEIPSDFDGVVYEQFDANGGWKQALGRELQAAGFEIDWNRVMRT